MIYAIQTLESGKKTLVVCVGDFDTDRYWASVSGTDLVSIDEDTARRWVLAGNEYEAGLVFEDDGRIAHAKAEV